MVSPSGLVPISMGGLPGMRMTAYWSLLTGLRSTSALTFSAARIRLSTMLASRTASDSTRSWALLLIVRVSTITRDTPKTAITTRTTARVDWMRRRRMLRYLG